MSFNSTVSNFSTGSLNGGGRNSKVFPVKPTPDARPPIALTSSKSHATVPLSNSEKQKPHKINMLAKH